MPREKYRDVDQALRAALALPDAAALSLTLPPAILAKDACFREVVFIGRGGMGSVYKAFDRSLEREVAIKLVRAGRFDRELGARLGREANALAVLKHPAIVQLFRVEEREDHTLLVMEHVAGVSLRRFARSSRELDPLLSVMLACGEALSAAHAQGFVHRDFKPENVIVRPDGRPCVLDFGLVRGVLPHTRMGTLTRPGDVLGTASYMAPEQARGERGDARSDQFSFAVTTWELFTGRHPRALAPELKPREQERALPAVLAEVLTRAMAERSEDRYATLDEVLRALARALSPAAPSRP